MYTGITIKGKQFETGKMTVLRRSLQDIFEHALDDEHIWEWLRNFNPHSLRKMKYPPTFQEGIKKVTLITSTPSSLGLARITSISRCNYTTKNDFHNRFEEKVLNHRK